MVYYIYTIEEKIRVPPNRLADNIEKVTLEIARNDFERKIFKDMGLCLVVFNPKILSPGYVVHDDAGVYYNVSFDMLVYKPEINEVMYGVVKGTVDFGAFVSIGPLEALLHISQIGNEKFVYNKNEGVLKSTSNRIIKEGTVVLGKISTVSLKSNVSDSKVGFTLRAPGLSIVSKSK